ncbi:MAG: TIGR03757 family integrating conjugative element protein [Proteobacteria bacterium]|nr:TIGR03757 family integrating conjugative element protein [Pseudomonadota bacterium]MCL2307193.1 TIGR03757 family integrating conjugative element protein [Pseudomonadota bacterium]
MRLRPLLIVLSAWFVGVAGAAEVLVFTDSAHPVTNAGGAKVIVLDRVLQIEKEMSVGLPTNIDQAERVATERLNSPDGARKLEELTQAYHGLMQAWQMGVSKVPAVVVEGRFVVYGQSDVAQAIAIIARKQQSNLLRGHALPTETRPTINMTPPKPTLTPKEDSP